MEHHQDCEAWMRDWRGRAHQAELQLEFLADCAHELFKGLDLAVSLVSFILGTQQPRVLADAGGGRGQDHGLRPGRDESRFGGQDVADPDRAGQLEQCRPGAVRTPQPAAERRREAVADPSGEGRSRPFDSQRGSGGPPMERPADPLFGGRRGPQWSAWWDVEPDLGRVAHGVPARVDRLRCLGNAVVPQVAEWIGRQIMEVADATV